MNFIVYHLVFLSWTATIGCNYMYLPAVLKNLDGGSSSSEESGGLKGVIPKVSATVATKLELPCIQEFETVEVEDEINRPLCVDLSVAAGVDPKDSTGSIEVEHAGSDGGSIELHTKLKHHFITGVTSEENIPNMPTP
ncbi:uncharacterized protein CELE_T16A1.4 [Caenorhabditis elegans]|uniref:Secreted protein n=1 Tax=Caenorhabditis elegans TaxID=6239 RepID=P91444_CAEEL|nr:Secreted protein [Caenorhabditis elegans]CCD68949.1 Secreted protein [Caenorhabditis elegans]|eukprot:NP_494174.1 Uncharacterized protein CELE_T16A1.4 [Caenorhabditis elegans]